MAVQLNEKRRNVFTLFRLKMEGKKQQREFFSFLYVIRETTRRMNKTYNNKRV